MNIAKSIATLTVVLLATIAQAGGIQFEQISLEKALKKAKSENKPLFIDIYATWCGPCKMLDRNVFVDDELGAYMNENFINLKLDGEKGDGDQLMTQFAMNAFPTMLYLSAEKMELERVVGYVSAASLLETSKTVIDPATSELYQLQQEYEAGSRDKETMMAYINALLEQDEDIEEVVSTYFSLYPKLDMTNEDDFFIFCVGVNDLEDPLNQAFLENIEEHNEEFPDMTIAKMKMLIFNVCEKASDENNVSLVDEGIDQMLEPLNKILDEPVSREELQEAMLEAVANS